MFIFAEHFLSQADNFERVFHEKEDELEGEIRILTTPYVGTHWLIPNMKEFLKKHPKVTVKFLFNNEEIRDLGDADIGICLFISQQIGLLQVPLFSLSVRLFANKEYLREMGTPQQPEDLDHHRLIIYKENYYAPYGNWILNVGHHAGMLPRKPYIQADNLNGMIQSALYGMGIIEAPDLTSILESDLQVVLPELVGPEVTCYFTYPEARKTSKKINFLLKYLMEKEK